MNDFKKPGAGRISNLLPLLADVKPGHISLTAVAAAVLTVSGCSTINFPGRSNANDYEIVDSSVQSGDRFSKRVYGSVGMGASRLAPDTSANSVYDVNEKVAAAGQVTVGADLTKTFSVEMHSADLGSAGLSPTGRINYHLNGGSALVYAGSDRKNRRGLSGYGRVGFGAMDNSAVGDVSFERANDTQLLVGAGAEYGWRNGIGVRGEVILFDKDAQFAQLGVIYRVGGRGAGGLAEAPIELPTAVVQAPTTLPEPTPAAAAPQNTLSKYTADSDQDGIYDTLDECPASAVGVAIDENGCAVFNGVIDGVNFERGSARLTATARSVLDNVVATLAKQPDALVAIGAHTDSDGNDSANMALSRNRAISVARYLINRGVPKNLMSARAFGELVPVADNLSSEGRAQNRRVELVASKGIAQ